MNITTSLYRDTLRPRTTFGFDTIQGLLELAQYGNSEGGVGFCVHESDRSRPYSLYAKLLDLEKGGYITLAWKPVSLSPPDSDLLRLETIMLTVQGHLLLDELKRKSKFGRLRSNFRDLIWVILTSIITTILTMRLTK